MSATTQFYRNLVGVGNVGVGTTLAPGSNIQVSGNVYAANALTTTNVFTNTLTVANTAAFTGSVNVTGNLYASNALTATNVFANTVTVAGNLYASNALATTNVFANTCSISNNFLVNGSSQFYDPIISLGSPSAGNYFGQAVAFSTDGNTAIVGTDGGDYVSIFRYANGSWGSATNISGTSGTKFGNSVAISADGNTVLVGAPYASSKAGSAAVYRYSGGSWGAAAPLASTATGIRPQFGISVALSADGNTALVGTSEAAGGLGYAAVYRYSGGSWGAASQLTNSAGANAFGWSVALSADGNTALVGAILGGTGGYAAVYRYSGGSWGSGPQAALVSTAGTSAQFGYSVALSADGNTALVGAFAASGATGYAAVYRYSGGSWGAGPQAALVSTAGTSAQFGNSVALSSDGNTALVGARGASSGAGYAAVFRYSNATWGSAYQLVGPSDPSGQFGWSVSLSGDGYLALVGALGVSSYKGYAAVVPSLPRFAVSSISSFFNGLVGIGTTTPTATLAVIGNAYVSNSITTTNVSTSQFLINGVAGTSGQIIQATGTGLQWSSVAAGLSQGILLTLPSAYTLGAPFASSVDPPYSNAYHINFNTTFVSQGASAVFSTSTGLLKFTTTGLYQLTCVLAGDQPIVKLAVGTSSSASFGSSTTAYTYVYTYPVNSSPSEVVTIPLNVTDITKYYYLDAYFIGNATQLYLTTTGSVTGTANGTWIQIAPFGSYLSSATGVASALLANCSTSSNLSGVYSSNTYRIALTTSNGWTVNGTSTSLAVTTNGNFQANQAGIYEVNMCLNAVGNTPVKFQVGSLSSDSLFPSSTTPSYLYTYSPMYTQDPTTVIQMPLNITNISNVYFVECSFAGTVTGNVALNQTSTFVSIKPIGGYINTGTNPWTQQGTSVYYNGGPVGLGVVPTALTETLTVSGNTSFVGNVTVTSDASSNNYVNARRVPAGSLPVSSYVTGRVPLTTTTNLIQNYLGCAASITANTSTGSITQALNLPGGSSTNSFVNFPPSISATFTNLATSNLFIEAWINPTLIAGANRTILQRNLGGTADFYFFITTAGVLTGSIINTAGATAASATSSTTITTSGSWVHVAFSYARTGTTAGTLYVFVNGAGTGSAGVSTQPRVTPTANICIGGDTLSSSMFYGNVADVRVMTGCIVPVTTFSPQSAPFTTAPTYVTGMSTGYTANLTMALQSQYFPGASVGPYGPTLTLPGTVGSYYASNATAVDTTISSTGFTIEAWVNYASLANSAAAFGTPESWYPYMLSKVQPTGSSGNWLFGATSNGAVSFYVTSSAAVRTANNIITTGQWNHIMAQCNGSNIYISVNGTFQTLTGTGGYSPNGNNTIAPAVMAITGTSGIPITLGQYNSFQGPNFAIAKARIVLGTSGANGNVYSSGNFTPNPNFNPTLPSGATVAWQLESQYPLPTYPSIQDVTELPQQASSYGSLPTPVGGVTSNVLGPYPGTYPQFDSIRFDGTGYIDYGNVATSVTTTNLWANSWTIEGWVYPTSLPCQLFERSNLASGFDFSSNVNASGQVNFYYGASTVGPTLATVPVNTWTHVAVTYDGTRSNIYVSSNIVGTANISTNASGSQAYVPTYGLHFGYNSVAGNYLNGNLADVRVSNVARYTGTTYSVPSQPFSTDANTLLLLKSLGGQVGTTLEVQGRGLNSVSLGATRTTNAYPPAPMSSYLLDTTSNSSVSYGVGKYIASASSELSANAAWYAYDSNNSTAWQSTASYSAAGVYAGSNVTVDVYGAAYSGEWLQLQHPVSLLLSSYTIYENATANVLTQWSVLGSREGLNWTLVDSRKATNYWPSAGTNTFTVSATQAYPFYRFVVQATNGPCANVYSLTFSGSEESLCITNDAKVGVGIANPQRSLEVAGDVVVGGTVSAGNPLMYRNRIINGDYRVVQKGTSFTIGTGGTNNTYTLDRWNGWLGAGSGSATWTYTQTAVVPPGSGLSNSLAVTVTSVPTTYSWSAISQPIEGYNIADLAWGTSYGSPVTISFWVKSSIAGNYSILLIIGGTASGGPPIYGAQYTISGVNAWQYITLSVPPPPNGTTVNTTSGIGVSINFGLVNLDTVGNAAGGTSPLGWSATGSNRWAVPGQAFWGKSLSDYFYITGVQFEKGTVATPFEVRPFGTELFLCQRYYQVIGQNQGSTTYFGTAFAYTTSASYLALPLGVSMRTAPTSVTSNVVGAYNILATGIGGQAVTSITLTSASSQSVGLQVGTAAVLTAGQGVLFYANNPSSTLGFAAEL